MKARELKEGRRYSSYNKAQRDRLKGRGKGPYKPYSDL
jgi:hypothetical protein